MMFHTLPDAGSTGSTDSTGSDAGAGTTFSYRWATWGDLNAFFSLFLDNILNLVVLSGLLSGVFGFPVEFVLTRMVPGTALGVLVGDLLYTWLAFRLARRTGRSDVTAMPLGLDTPSTIGIALVVLGPVFKATGDPYAAWYTGMATLFFMGVVKVLFSFLGDWVRSNIPQAGLLGSIGGVGIALLAFLPLLHVFAAPIVGMVALGLVVYSLVARLRLPGGVPGAFAAVLVGTILYYVLGPLGLLGSHFRLPALTFTTAVPWPSFGFVHGIGRAIAYLPVAIPFGLLTVIGGINVTESARVAGDDYKTRDILLVEAGATLVAALCGGVAQSTPYIGHPAYKAMGGRAGDTVATGLLVGVGGMLGLVPFIVDALPVAAVMPRRIFIGMEIVAQADHTCPRNHAGPVVLAFLPVVAELVRIHLDKFGVSLDALSPGDARESYMAITMLGHGFILTAMLWGGAAAHVVERQFTRAAILLALCGVFTSVGLIHSVLPAGNLYLPWDVDGNLHLLVASGYFVLAFALLIGGLKAGIRKAPLSV